MPKRKFLYNQVHPEKGERKVEWKLFTGVIVSFMLVGLASFDSFAKSGEKQGKAKPIIRQSFASKSLWPGETWKVYLNASDEDGNMKHIVCTIEQPGMGTYPVSFTRIKEENRRELSGYIYLNTIGMHGLNLPPITLTVQIQDRTGNFSDPVSFPLRFQEGVRQEDPPGDTYKEMDLGPIMITLQSFRGE
ncbi:MAG: hypothetical protein QME78_14820 [Thermodesulfobacteriota bacterium]|nr:hypothetical protein [Thermodesulfobacteriota bacterium]